MLKHILEELQGPSQEDLDQRKENIEKSDQKWFKDHKEKDKK